MNGRAWALIGLALAVTLVLAAVALARPGLLRTSVIIPSPDATSPATTNSALPGAGTSCDALYANCIAECRTAGGTEASCATNCEPVLYDPTCLEDYGTLEERYDPYLVDPAEIPVE